MGPEMSVDIPSERPANQHRRLASQEQGKQNRNVSNDVDAIFNEDDPPEQHSIQIPVCIPEPDAGNTANPSSSVPLPSDVV